MRGRRRLALGAAAVVLAGGVAGVLLLRGGEAVPPVDDELAACAGRGSPCYLQALRRLVGPVGDPRPVVEQIGETAWSDPAGFLLPSCHGLMHTVGREYALRHGVTVASLVDYLPRSNDPGCPAGFAHGLISGIAPQLDLTRPAGAAAVCEEAETRYRRYSCVHGFGHAFMRITGERLSPALELCGRLGPRAAPDCAQGAFHDYWFSVIGFDGASAADARPVTEPRELCGPQPPEYVRQCWYRAFVDTRPAGFVADSADVLDRLCAGLEGLQREACITAASVIGPPDPRDQLALCARLAGADASACLRGVKVQNLLDRPPAEHVDLTRRCGLFAGETRIECYRWLGKVLAVLTDGAFLDEGCPSLVPAAAAACAEGARAMDEPLVTFS